MTYTLVQSATSAESDNPMGHSSHCMVAYNKAAILSLQQGDPVTSLKIFQMTLTTAHAQLDPRCGTSVLDVKQHPVDKIRIRSAAILEDPDLTENCKEDKDVLQRFTRAFDIATLPTGGRCVALLYNMALSYDVRTAFVSSDNNADIFRATQVWREQAMKLYQSALEMAKTTWGTEEVAAMRCILLAITNNLGRLSALQMSHDKARECLVLSRDLLRPADAVHQIPLADFERLYRSLGPFLYLTSSILPVASAA